jgi:hypothetical protein
VADQAGTGPCRPCEIAWGSFGVIAGLVLLFIGADLLTGGAITRAISGGTDDQS